MALTDLWMLGYKQAVKDIGRCGALNPDRDADKPGMCLRMPDHSGKHDDLFQPPWGNARATAEENCRDPRFEIALRSEDVRLSAERPTSLNVQSMLDEAGE